MPVQKVLMLKVLMKKTVNVEYLLNVLFFQSINLLYFRNDS